MAISFCTAAGRLQNTLWRHDQTQYRLAAAHARRHAAQPASERLACARALIAAKLHNYLAWFRDQRGPDFAGVRQALQAALPLLDETRTLDQLRGVEGMAAREVFGALNHQAPAFFRSAARRPHEHPDPWNVLLDFAYSLLFQRINALLRVRGLDPFLGFLHSSDARYESLVCDLQEPFRARCDRFVLKLVNRGQIQPADFTPDPYTGPNLSSAAAGRFLELFAQELDTRLAHEAATWSRLIETQVLVLERWVSDGHPFRVFYSRDPASAVGRPPTSALPEPLEAPKAADKLRQERPQIVD